MKILIVLPNNAHGGAEQYLKMIASFFKQEDVTIIFLKKGTHSFWKDLEDSTKQKHISSKNEALGFLKFAFNSLFSKKKHYDYIFTSHVYVNGLIGFLLSLKKINTKKFIARESTSIFLRYKGISRLAYQIMYRFGYKKMNVLICQTELMKNQLVKHLPYLNKITKIRVIPNPIDVKLIALKSKLNDAINIEGDFIVSAGRLITEKGFDILIKAFSEIKKKHTNLKLVILGDGHLKKELLELTTSLDLEDSVVFTGHVNNVYTYFKNAKICVVSSRIEGFPNVLLQMMSQNNNVVSTLCAGGIDKIPGIITLQPNDTDALSNAIVKSIDLSDREENKIIFANYLNTRDISHFIETILEE